MSSMRGEVKIEQDEGAEDIDDALGDQLPGDGRGGAINQERLAGKLVELDVGEKRLDEIGGDPRLDALGLAGQQRLAHLRDDRFRRG